MTRILVPLDGSETALRALDQAVAKLPQGGEIRLLNVQPAIPASVGDFVGADAVDGHHRDEGEKGLRAGKERLALAKIAHAAEVRVGKTAETIAAYADETGCDEIVIGGSGSGLAQMILGSTATRVLDLASVPVTVVE